MVVICLECGADLHTAQLMPLPLTVSCFSEIQIGFTFPVPAHPGSPGQRVPLNGRVCVCITVEHLPVAEAQLRTGESAGSFADLVGEAKALDDRQHGGDVEQRRAFAQLITHHAPAATPDHRVHLTYTADHICFLLL